MESITAEIAFMATSAGKAFVILMDPVRLHRMQAHNRRTASGMAWPNVIGKHLFVYRQLAPQPALSAPSLASNAIAFEYHHPTESAR